CDLYLGNHNQDGAWSYCGSDGYYTCQGNDCVWQSPTCPSGSTGNACQPSTDCASGCYCANGTCEEGGFCATDADCGAGYHCDTMRSSCIPNPPVPVCGSDSDCPTGQYCDSATLHCTATCTCVTDADAV